MAIRIVEPQDLDAAMQECELSEVYGDMDDRVPFTQDEVDAMAEDPCAFGYHTMDPDEGLCCINCSYAIG